LALHLSACNLRKVFNRRLVLDNITCSLSPGETMLVSGRNGSGKSTLARIFAGVLTPTAGVVTIEGSDLGSPLLIGFVAPYLNLYDEFTPTENLEFARKVRGIGAGRSETEALLERVGLARFRHTPARVFSSGMKQRLKVAFALCHRPPILILDEPMSNLDEEGKIMVRRIMDEQTGAGILVVATNERSDVPRFTAEVNLDANG
jgi:heme exporter protein A